MKKLKLQIQLFAEQPDNDVVNEPVIEDDNLDIGDEEVDFEQPIDKTKAFSERLNKKTMEIEAKYNQQLVEEKNKIAKLKGFKDWDEFDNAIQNDTLIEMGVEDIDKFQQYVKNAIDSNPDMLKAKEIIAKQESQQQEAILNDQVRQINSIDANIKTVDDILNLENYNEVYEKVKSGYSLKDAYILCNLDKINLENVSNARKNALEDITSKGHLKKIGGNPTNDVVVPSDVYMTYKRNLPNWSEEQIKKDYAKRIKE